MKRLILMLLFSALFFRVAVADVAIITHKSCPISQINKRLLLDIYTCDVRYWDNGSAVVPLDLKEKNETKKLFYKFLGRSTSRMKSIWMKNKLSGEGDPPLSMSSEEKMLETIYRTPGSIGFIDAEMVNDSVKVLRIIQAKEKQ